MCSVAYYIITRINFDLFRHISMDFHRIQLFKFRVLQGGGSNKWSFQFIKMSTYLLLNKMTLVVIFVNVLWCRIMKITVIWTNGVPWNRIITMYIAAFCNDFRLVYSYIQREFMWRCSISMGGIINNLYIHNNYGTKYGLICQ